MQSCSAPTDDRPGVRHVLLDDDGRYTLAPAPEPGFDGMLVFWWRDRPVAHRPVSGAKSEPAAGRIDTEGLARIAAEEAQAAPARLDASVLICTRDRPAGTMDALLPIDHHARAYARRVEAQHDDDAGKGHGSGWGRWQREPAYRLYEVQNGNHIETYQDTFPQLELIMPHAQRAFDLLVRHVEQRTPLPPDQCIGRGGVILDAPTASGKCAQLFVP